MKPVLLLLALIGLTWARPQFQHPPQVPQNRPPQFRPVARAPLATILRYNANLGLPTGFSYAVDTSNGISEAVIGNVRNQGTKDESLAVEGQYSYVGDDGQTYLVHYTADENGFQPAGQHIPPAANTRKLGIPSAALASLAGGGLG
ncbi:cuticle protein CP14.6-like [Euwallacea similis]|uniref:cuticle protein CP14.6-like n=1 Tax=Euwallacea similis TaxID=1736056 RepID=UPI003450948E